MKTVGTGTCTGRTEPACIVFNSLNLVPGVNQGEYLFHGTSAASNIFTWQGAGVNCALVPTRNATWGQVKSLYR